MTNNVTSGPLPFVVYSGDVYRPVYVGNNYAATTILPADGTNSKLLVTGAPGYVLTNIGFQIDNITTIAVAGMISIIFSDSSFGTMANYRWYIPQNITNPTLPANDRVVNGPGFYFHNTVANSSLSVHVDTALLTGQVRCFARYALTQYLAGN